MKNTGSAPVSVKRIDLDPIQSEGIGTLAQGELSMRAISFPMQAGSYLVLAPAATAEFELSGRASSRPGPYISNVRLQTDNGDG